eukprot:gnl/MRDRNA2_/MRDRNA2_113368_c0_seq1.p1 gnl/MRDRNA2_/MRDRNA2_113368_c0~~gnl/MRDRNA2_/MRDRNA2_113368_c0_seq1.p1  ORF type:complete len:205 (-),score=35.93 gnl/MRDRNA2_/MRDRNA2_113368_c0_seq1:180-725(-)
MMHARDNEGGTAFGRINTAGTTGTTGTQSAQKRDLCAQIFGDTRTTEMIKSFQEWEHSHEGQVNVSDLGVLMRAQGLTPSESQLAMYRKSLKNDVVDLPNFLEFCAQTGRDEADFEDLVQFFLPFDEKQTGRIPVHVFRNLMQNMGERFLAEEVDEMIRDCCSNDQSIDYREFLQVISQKI